MSEKLTIEEWLALAPDNLAEISYRLWYGAGLKEPAVDYDREQLDRLGRDPEGEAAYARQAIDEVRVEAIKAIHWAKREFAKTLSETTREKK